MGFARTTAQGEGGWGMGFLLVFFPGDDDQDARRRHKFGPFCLPLRRAVFGHLLLRAQTAASICLLILFTAVLLFTVSTLPSSPPTVQLYGVPRRQLAVKTRESRVLPHALQGMGTLYRRGTAAMSEIVVAHAAESLSLNELRLFLRLFLRSGLASRSDLVLIFPARKAAIDDAILQEKDYFSRILSQYRENSSNSSRSPASFDVTQFLKTNRKEKQRGEPIWGKRIKANLSDAVSIRPIYGSVVGFEAEELDQEHSLSGFVDHPPISLRRWACYPILLGRVKRNFKHMMLIDPKSFWLVGDPLIRVRTYRSDSVLLHPNLHQGRHMRKIAESNNGLSPTHRKSVHPGIVMGGSRGVRRLSNAMLMNLVNALTQRKKKSTVGEANVFNQLVDNAFILNNIGLVVSDEPVAEPSSSSFWNHTVVRRASGDVDFVSGMVMRHLCSFPLDSLVHHSECNNVIE